MATTKDAIHYIAAKFGGDDFAKTKVGKTLWFADKEAYLKLGNPIASDAIYTREKYGPMLVNLTDILDELCREKKLEYEQISSDGFSADVYKKGPQSGGNWDKIISESEAEIMDAVGTKFRNYTATEISNIAHDAFWRVTPPGEVMTPMDAAVLGMWEPEDDPAKLRQAEELLKEHKI